MENWFLYGADVRNAFEEASLPKQGFHIQPDAVFLAWYTHKHSSPLPHGLVIPVLTAMQRHPEAPHLRDKHADTIIRSYVLTLIKYEPCLYLGLIDGERVFFMQQVDDFASCCAISANSQFAIQYDSWKHHVLDETNGPSPTIEWYWYRPDRRLHWNLLWNILGQHFGELRWHTGQLALGWYE